LGLSHLLQLCRVFLSDLGGHSQQRTERDEFDFLSANDVTGALATLPSDGT